MHVNMTFQKNQPKIVLLMTSDNCRRMPVGMRKVQFLCNPAGVADLWTQYSAYDRWNTTFALLSSIRPECELNRLNIQRPAPTIIFTHMHATASFFHLLQSHRSPLVQALLYSRGANVVQGQDSHRMTSSGDVKFNRLSSNIYLHEVDTVLASNY